MTMPNRTDLLQTLPPVAQVTRVARAVRRGYDVDFTTTIARRTPELVMTVTVDTLGTTVIEDTLLTFQRQKQLAERALEQTSDDDFFRTIDSETNSIAIIVKHIGGNLHSRWTDFLTSDGEKPTRDRDGEFIVPGQTSRADVMITWDTGWTALFDAFAKLRATDLLAEVQIRAETMTALAAMHRAVAHISQHVGQIVLLAKHYRSSDWKTLSIPRGRSADWQSSPHSPTR